VASRALPAAILCFFAGFSGSAATGIAEFQEGRAFFPVATGAGAVPVLFPARAGEQFFIRFRPGILLCVFWHLINNRTCGGIITHMRINHLKDRIKIT